MNEIWEGQRIAPDYDESQWICDQWVGYVIVKKDDEPFYTVLTTWRPMNGDKLAALGGAPKFADAVKLIKHEEQRRRQVRRSRVERVVVGRMEDGTPYSWDVVPKDDPQT